MNEACVTLIMMCTIANGSEAVAIPIVSPRALEYHTASNWFWGLNQGVGLTLPLLLLVTGWGARLYKVVARIFRERRVLSLSSFEPDWELCNFRQLSPRSGASANP